MAKIVDAKDMGLSRDDKVEADQVFLFFAHARTGHHAVIEYIGRQFKGDVFHMNYCDWNSDLWLGCFNTVTPFGDKRSARVITSNYENFDLSKFKEDRAIERVDKFVTGKPPITTGIIVRDPYNHFYSWYNRQRHVKLNKQKYVQHAKEFLGDTSYLGDNCLKLNYNKWCIDKDYRHEIFTQIDGDEFNDQAANHVPVWAGGSTVDNMKHQGRAWEMKTRERWRGIAAGDLKSYGSYLFDDEVIDLACRIHNHKFILPIVDALRKKLQ